MPVPLAVKKQAEKAKQLEDELRKQQQGQGEPEPVEPEPAEPEPQPSEPEPEPEPQPSAEVWEQRYKTLQGKYNTEIGRLQESLRSLQAENDFLKGKLTTLEGMIQQQAANPQPTQQPQEDPLEVIKNTLPEVYEALTKYTSQFVRKEELPNISEEVENKIKPIVQNTFNSTLASLVPDWETLNTDPEFIEWLQRPAPYTDKTLHELMLEYFQNGDAHKVAQFFLDYKKEKQQASQQQAQPSTGVAPPRRQAAVSQPQSPRLVKREEIVKFYRDAALGRYTPEQKAQLEAEYIKAIQENRVID